jgi:hypothetical protein
VDSRTGMSLCSDDVRPAVIMTSKVPVALIAQ